MNILCIVIDDEPLAVKKIAAYIGKVPFLELAAECRSAAEAMNVMNSVDVQLLFIDINMPEISGMEFAKSLTNKPYIVFTTAYSEYAVEGFQVEAVDYLLKPISFSNFLKAVNKVKNRIELTSNNQKESVTTKANHLFVKSDYKLIRIELTDIKYIESQHEYIKIYLNNSNPITTLLSLKSIEEVLPPEKFMRVHRSFIVNLSKISVIERNRIVYDGNVYIPVSKQYKEKFLKYIDGNLGYL
ncbi:MAG: response regulator transcription factor [Bacteroidales bacterium]|nr:response regulator transcription factor [Bacteroidales bacterium]MBK7171706.1 response regulator transcription factor [Bacteroidales bacterium]